ncbi:metal ABC transporter permease [Anaerococcus sp. AGMB09787]|uniref:metal ABC transporter permease n=1 Tax=Anaerococcus sp. AGMB09787 TaxID=2922869 RepID=UPI001FB016A2|nr:metal ABC transporter permease [Anaerococcus sp. AGMB09787]
MSIESYISLIFSSYEVLINLTLAALACSVIGVFLLLRKMSMVADAISHTVLLGIVVAFLITRDINSPLLIVGASIFGIITVFAIESLSKTGLVKNEDAVGIIFPLFFAIAVILISRYARNANLDADMVLMGEVIMTPLSRIEFMGWSMSTSFVKMGIMLIINLVFVFIFFKELKITSFDSEYASIVGFSSTILFYALMSLASLTAVSAFETVGAILVVSFLISPPASAYLLTKDLKNMILVSMGFAVINSLIGYLVGIYFDLSISGASAFASGLTFGITFLFNKDGLIRQAINRKKAREELDEMSVIIHIGNHQGSDREDVELNRSTIYKHLNWDKDRSQKILANLIKNNIVTLDKNKIYRLSEKGQNLYEEVRRGKI